MIVMQCGCGVLGWIRVLLAERTGADEINAQGMPWKELNILFDRNLATLEMAFLQRLANHAGLASAFDLGSQPNEHAVLAWHQLWVLCARVQQMHMVPLDCFLSQGLMQDNLLVASD